MPTLPLDLHRACKKNRQSSHDLLQAFSESKGATLLYPDYDGFVRKDGSIREPDVTWHVDELGQAWVSGIHDIDPKNRRPSIDPNEGVSLSTAAGKFGFGFWYYFLLPKGTATPECFDIAQTGRDEGHYSIRLKNRMRKDAYEGALDAFARAALAKAVEEKRASLAFK